VPSSSPGILEGHPPAFAAARSATMLRHVVRQDLAVLGRRQPGASADRLAEPPPVELIPSPIT